MEFWRRWRVVGMVALLGAVSANAMAAGDPAVAAKALETAHGPTAVSIRVGVIADTKGMSLVEKDAYGTKMVGTVDRPAPFAKLLTSTNPDAQLNAAIAIAEVGTLSTDATLEDMLKNPNPAVRYWGAQGLANIMPSISSVGDGTKVRAIKALTDALNTEQSGLVKLQIINALGKAGDVAPLVGAVTAISSQIQSGKADNGTLDAAATALSQFDAVVRAKNGGIPKADASAVAKAAAWTASFAAQQQVVLKEKREKEGNELPDGYAASATSVVTNAVHVLNDLTTRGSFKAPAGDESPEALQIMVDGLTGSASAGQGDLQKLMPDVPVPPAIKK